MARIRRFLVGNQSVGPHPSEVDCFYQLVRAPGGQLLLHLSTFGSADRASAPKSSQSLQIDESRAEELIDVLQQAFPTVGGSSTPRAMQPPAGKTILKTWLVEALRNLGGAGKVVAICREVWRLHGQELEASDDLAFTWQYDIRWAAKILRDEGVLVSAAEQVDNEWRLAPGHDKAS